MGMETNKYLIVSALGTNNAVIEATFISDEFIIMDGGPNIMFKTNGRFDALHHLAPGHSLVVTENK